MGRLIKKIVSSVVVVMVMFVFSLPAGAQQATLDDLLKRVEAVEKKNVELSQENASLKSELMLLKDQQTAQQTQISDVQAKAVQTAQAAAPAPAVPTEGNPVTSKLKMQLYGFIMAEGVYSTNNATSSSTAGTVLEFNAPHQTISKQQKNYNVSAQNTRLGLNITGPDLGDGKTSGKIEIDFNNPNSSGTTYQPRLRLAYVQDDYEKWGITAGQAWDFVAPMNSSTLNQSNVWRAGNVGFRHPQMYLTNKWGEVLGGKLTTQVGIIDPDDLYVENAGAPVIGAYANYATKVMDKDVALGVGGLYGTSSTKIFNVRHCSTSGGQTYDCDNNDLYGVITGLTVGLTKEISIKGEGYYGGKLSSFLSGPAGQSVPGVTDPANLSNSKPLKTLGGFAEINWKATPKLQFNLGAGMDDVVNQDAIIASAADQALMWQNNSTYYTNLKYNLTKELVLGLEFQHFRTNWVDGVRSYDDRIETAVIYNF